MRCHYEGTGVFEGLCLGTKECDSCIGYERCATFKPDTKTNADRIRAMSDEELEKFLGGWAIAWKAWKCDGLGECLDWLKQPVKDGEDDGN